jgi:hypothetical protein
MAKTRRGLLKQFAILDASMKIAFFPEILDLVHHPIYCRTINYGFKEQVAARRCKLIRRRPRNLSARMPLPTAEHPA